jgi:hypothetical protein
MHRAGIAAVMAIVSLAAGNTPAHAQVFVDPDSPSGKEYAIPLESARRHADPGYARGTKVQSGTRTAPLFGAGIVAKRPASSDEDARKSTRKGSADGQAGGRSEDGVSRVGLSADVRKAVTAAASRPGTPDGGLGLPAILTVTLGLLGTGVGVGALLRRRHDRAG